MNNISFPGLGLNFNFSSIAFTLFNIDIYWYSICIVFGIIVALILCRFSKENFDIKFIDIIDVTIVSLVFGIIGARLYYVIFNFNYFFSNPLEIIKLRDGGLGIYGGLILGIITGIYRARKLEIKILDLLDYVVPFIAIAQSIGRFGNFFNVEAYGIETKNLFRMSINNGLNFIEVHPTFFYESICTFVIFCILRILQKNRKFDGQIFLFYIILYSFIRFWIEGIRIDSLMFLGFRISQVISVFMFVIGITIYLIKTLNLNDKYNLKLKNNV